MTVNGLAVELIRAHNDNQDDSDMILTVEQWIRDALDELALETNWKAFETYTTLTTGIGTPEYTLPINVRDIAFIRDPVNEKYVVYAEHARLAELHVDFEKQGEPDFWMFAQQVVTPPDVQNKIRFQPVPSSVINYDIGYQIVPARLLSMDTIPIQNEAILPLKFLVRAYMHFDDNNYDHADRFYQRYVSTVDKLMRRENNKSADIPRLQPRDIPRSSNRRFARLDRNHFH
jgi:hypothetical protein